MHNRKSLSPSLLQLIKIIKPAGKQLAQAGFCYDGCFAKILTGSIPHSNIKIKALALYIINSKGIVYHQHTVLHLIKSQVDARWRVMRYSP